MNIKYFQKGFNYSQDGPGNRLVYHLHGCNLHCPWCSNPEGMTVGKIYEKFPVTDIDIDDVFNEIISCKPMFFDGGGVTFTGGEVTLQLDSVIALFKRLHSAGINTAIETNAEHPSLPSLFPYLDHLILDVKSPREERLSSVIGGKLDPIIKNLYAAKNIDTLIHIPLIHGFNDSDDDITDFIKLLSPFKNQVKLELLAYHEYGKEKWEKCGLAYQMQNAFVDNQCFSDIETQFKQAGFNLIKT